MRKYNDLYTAPIKRAAKGTVISVILAAVIFSFSSDELFYNFLINETMPIFHSANGGQAFLKFSEDRPESAESSLNENAAPQNSPDVLNKIDLTDSVSVFSNDEIVLEGPNQITNEIVGINDIVFQDEAAFGELPDVLYKENFTAESLDILKDTDFFLSSFYNKDAQTGLVEEMFDVYKFFNTDLSLPKNPDEPQVLIFHTHGGTEYFIDSDTGDIYEGIIGAGQELKYVLEQKYGIRVLHHTGIYDMIDGKSNRDGSYERMEPEIQRILDENPSIQVVIDLHRDGIEPDPNLVTTINGKRNAKIMFVNGVSALNENEEAVQVSSLPNENLENNLAFSFNMQIAANEIYPDLTRKVYLKPYRYSTHMMGKSLLVEIGSQYNTKEEAFNSMELLADLINEVVFE